MTERVTPEQLKQAMRAWITGVAVVTGCHAGVYHGMTVNSFNSIALSPPTVMVALQHSTRTQNVVKTSGFFGVTILDVHQQELAQRFAGQLGEEQSRFEGVETFSMVTGAPMIKGGLAFFDCEVVNAFDVGATTVFFAEVLAIAKDENVHAPLLYLNRRWRKLAEE